MGCVRVRRISERGVCKHTCSTCTRIYMVHDSDTEHMSQQTVCTKMTEQHTNARTARTAWLSATKHTRTRVSSDLLQRSTGAAVNAGLCVVQQLLLLGPLWLLLLPETSTYHRAQRGGDLRKAAPVSAPAPDPTAAAVVRHCAAAPSAAANRARCRPRQTRWMLMTCVRSPRQSRFHHAPRGGG